VGVRWLNWGLAVWLWAVLVQSSAHAQPDAATLRIGVLAYRGVEATRERWEPTRQALRQALPAHGIDFLVANQSELTELVANGQLDFVLTQPLHFVQLRSRHGLAATATLMPRVAGKPVAEFGGVAFVRTDNAHIHRLDDVAGARVAAVMEDSLGGYRMQQWELYKLGILLPRDVAGLTFVDQPQDGVIQAVVGGLADVGFVRTGVLEDMVREGKLQPHAVRALPSPHPVPFPVLLSTDLYPEWPFSATRAASAATIKLVTLALLNISPDSQAARRGGYYGFSPPGDYTALEAMLLRLDAHPDRSADIDWRSLMLRYPLEIGLGLVGLWLLAMLAAWSFWWLSVNQRRLAQERNLLLQSLGEGVYGVDERGVCTFINPAALDMLGLTESEVLGQPTHPLFHHHRPDGAVYPQEDCPVYLTLVDGRARDVEEHLFHHTQGAFPVRMLISPLVQQDKVAGAVVVFSNIAERQRQEAELRVAATALETQEGICITDGQSRIVRVNGAFTEVTGYTQAEVLGKTPAVLSSGLHPQAFYGELWAQLLAQGAWQGEVWNRRKNGEVYPEWLNITAVRSSEGDVTHYVATFMDTSQRKNAEAQIRSLAFYDPLTQLPNRRLLRDRLLADLQQVPQGGAGGVLFVDLDDFKRLNDSEGHAAGDQLLQEVAQRLRACVGSVDRLARPGGDEFVIRFSHVSTNQAEVGEVGQRLAQQVRDSLGQPYRINGHVHHTSPSIGVVLYGHDVTLSRDPEVAVAEILRRGDLAMYQAKAAGGNTIRFFDPEMQVAADERARMEADLRVALETRAFELHYQLQFDGEGRPVGAEALLRWPHPTQGWISPARFIPVAERSGLIVPLGQWVLATACQQLRQWQSVMQVPSLHMAVNVSARQFVQAEFEDQVAQVIQASGIAPQGLKLEITESLLLQDLDDSLARMQRLRAMGVTFSLDDFGTGYASLAYLQRLPVDQLKIDASFVRRLPDHAADAAIASTIISMGRSLGLTVVAEGVETAAQRDWLAERGCHLFQGYWLARPVPADKLFV
jgi:diguanylate cyclase (GGDEF)-like protein/PAS domain S-box-containing protein